jgi:hypothetical protein
MPLASGILRHQRAIFAEMHNDVFSSRCGNVRNHEASRVHHAARPCGGDVAARAQQPAMPVIGFLHSGSSDPGSSYWPALAAFRQGVEEAGFLEGRNLPIEYRWAKDQFNRLPTLAGDLVRLAVASIFVGGGDVAALARKASDDYDPHCVRYRR